METTVFGAILFAVQGFILLRFSFLRSYCFWDSQPIMRQQWANLHASNNFDIQNHSHTTKCLIQLKLMKCLFYFSQHSLILCYEKWSKFTKIMSYYEKQNPKRLRFSSHLVENQAFINKYILHKKVLIFFVNIGCSRSSVNIK